MGLTGLVSDNPFVFNLSKTFLVPVIIKLPFRVVLSAPALSEPVSAVTLL